jgi:hypothetical protein
MPPAVAAAVAALRAGGNSDAAAPSGRPADGRSAVAPLPAAAPRAVVAARAGSHSSAGGAGPGVADWRSGGGGGIDRPAVARLMEMMGIGEAPARRVGFGV